MTTTQQDDWLERVLGVATTALPALPDEDPPLDTTPLDVGALGLDTADLWQGAVAVFQSAVETVDGQLSQLQSALRDSDDPDLHEIAEYGLNGVTGNTRVPLMAAIREAGTGAPDQLRKAAPKLGKAIEAFRSHLSSEPRVAACDNNPFDVPVAIRDTYDDALEQMEEVLRRAA